MWLSKLGMWREVFFKVCDPEVYLDSQNIAKLIRQALGREHKTTNGCVNTVALKLRRDADLSAARLRSALEEIDDQKARLEARRHLLVQCAPLAATFGSPLQGLSAPSVFEDPIHLRLMTLLSDDIGVGKPEMSRTDAFRRLAWDNGATNCIGTAQSLPGVSEICDLAFASPAVLLSLSRRSDVFCLSLIGIDFALRSIGTLPPFRLFGELVSTKCSMDLSKAQCPGLFPKGRGPLDESADILNQLSKSTLEYSKVVAGVEIGGALVSAWTQALIEYLEVVIQLRMAMAKLLTEKARSASLYHADFKLEGKPLTQWFAQAQKDPFPLLDALARSRLVRPGAPERSLLTNSLIALEGAMFRIFSPDDIAVINSWIFSIEKPETQSQTSQYPNVLSFSARNIRSGDPKIGDYPSSLREAYTVLQGRALPPRTREFAEDYCRFWLSLSLNCLDKTSRSLPRRYQPEIVRDWLMEAHDNQGKDFLDQRSCKMPTREEVIEETLQLAPMTLIDGAWLQGFTEVSLAASQFGSSLFETYWDELGNGQYEINHPKVFRDVLREMGIELPSTGSVLFANDPRLLTRSFRLPVYWLCLGKSPNTFCPEILGMNLAMELSGVGGAYRQARSYLKHYGYSTLFVDLHNTIDNVTTGHSAWAVDAINTYMLRATDADSIETLWTRVRVGYESLSPLVEDTTKLDFFEEETQHSPNFSGLHYSSHRPLGHEAIA